MRLPEHFSKISPTYIENWNPALYKLSIPQRGIRLSLEEVRGLGRSIHRWGKWFPDGPSASFQRVACKVACLLSTFPSGAFIRLGSRSAKDSYYALTRGLRVTDSQSAMRMLTGGSLRVALDLILALRNQYKPYIFVRDWLNIPNWSEFRCFMKDRKLVGISQYDCKNLGHCPEIAENKNRIKAAIEVFFKKFQSASHLDEVVFDVFLDVKQGRLGSSIDAKLLELNPFFQKTDPCLFDWSVENDFDGSFRFL